MPSRAMRRIVVSALGCAAIVAPAIALAAPSSPSASKSAAALPVCQPTGLVIWLNTSGNGAAGTTFYKLNFTNLSGHACTLQGFPFVLGIDLNGHRIGKAARFNRTHTPPPVVTLNNGHTHTAILGIVDVGNFPRSRCHPVTAAGLKVFAPTGVATTPKIVPFPFGACSSTRVSYMNVARIK
jgi:hypothetical protein